MTPLRGHDLERPDAMISFRIAGSEPSRLSCSRTARHAATVPGDPPARRPAAPVPSSDTGARHTLTAAGYRSTVRRCRGAITDIDYQENS